MSNIVVEQKTEEARELWKECFGDSESYLNYYFSEKTKDNEMITLYEEKELVSMVHLNPYKVSLMGQESMLHYIVGVATKESYRKQGKMRTLLLESFSKMYKKKEWFTFLMPASYAIYEPFDFQTIYTQKRLKGNRKKQFVIDDRCQMKKWDELSCEEQEMAVTYVNQKLEKQCSLYTVRSVSYYDRLAKEMKAAGGDVLVFFMNQTAGIIPYMYEDGKVEVTECVLEYKYNASIMSLFFSKFRLTDQIQFLETAFLDMETVIGFMERYEVFEKGIIMARIIHFQELMKQFRSKEEKQIVIGVTDELIPENNQVFELIISNHQCDVVVSKKEPVVTKSIAQWTNLLLGSQTSYLNEIV